MKISFCLISYREETLHKLPQAALLHHRQVDWVDDGRHSQAGGQDATGAGQATEGRIGARNKANLVSDGPLEKIWINWVKLSVGRAEIAICRARTPHVSQLPKKKPVTAEDLKHPYYCIFHPPTQFQSQNIRFGVPFHLKTISETKIYPFSGASGHGPQLWFWLSRSIPPPWDKSIKRVLPLLPPSSYNVIEPCEF